MLTPEDKQKIRDLYRVAQEAGNQDPTSASTYLNQTRQIAEPESNRPLLPQPPSDMELLDSIDQNTAASLADSPQFGRIMELVHQNPPQAGAMLLFLMKAGKIDSVNADRLRVLLERKFPDPNWTPKVTETPSLWRDTFGNKVFELATGESVGGQCFPEFIEEAVA